MTVSERYSEDPALAGSGPKPTDSDLPIRRRTLSGPYLIAILLIIGIGIALVAFGAMRVGESTSQIEGTPGALAPTEQLAPATGDQNSLRDNEAGANQPLTAPSDVEERPGAVDVPGGG